MAWFGRRKIAGFTISRGSATVVKHAVWQGPDVEIPAEVEGVPVLAIAPKAFSGSALESISLPDSLSEIGARAFEDCTKLAHIELPDALTHLAEATFSGCTALTEVCLPYGLKTIGARAFEGCTSLRSLYYFSKRGISAVMRTDRSLREDVLPMQIEKVGPAAFSGCSSLTRVTVPYLVHEVAQSTFENCASLETVEFHQKVKSIGPGAFANCASLKSVHLPAGLRSIGSDAFDAETVMISAEGSATERFAEASGHEHRVPLSLPSLVTSQMIPASAEEAPSPFYSEDVLAAAVEQYELRPPSLQTPSARSSAQELTPAPSRFRFEAGTYFGEAKREGTARIMMVGDIMARARQIRSAETSPGVYDFDYGFRFTKRLLSQADLTIGNLETTVSSSAPTTEEQEHVNARPHLNAPEALLHAAKRAGFDAMVNAQNHIYDSGTRGVYETLASQNRQQLMHTGAFASPEDQRFLLVDIGGIRVGIVSYLDAARQQMKRANFTKEGLETMFPAFNAKNIRQDISAARKAGAEFIIAYCHWGREYTGELSKRQRAYAQLVAESGADFIFGAHSHCIQPYKVLRTTTGRLVPCLFSGSNFLSDMNVKPPITRDTLVMDIELSRDDRGKVSLTAQRYHPCRIVHGKKGDTRDYTVIPTRRGGEVKSGYATADARIVAAVGPDLAPA